MMTEEEQQALVEENRTLKEVRHRPGVCSQCGQDLSAVAGRVIERRQVLDLPAIRLLAHEHQIEAVCCPTCHTTSLGSFPASVSAPVQYGPNLQALAVYLHQGQLLQTARTCVRSRSDFAAVGRT